MIDLLLWIGSIFGVLGAMLIALNVRCSKHGFVCFLLSNACLFAYVWQQANYPLLALYSLMSLTSAIGIFRWFMPRPRRRVVNPVRLEIGRYRYERPTT